MNILELFAGIGACSKALENIGIDLEIVDAVEIDKYAIASFNAIHGTNFDVQDITKWNKELKDIDIMTWGFPCQDISIAGNLKGIEEGKTRSGLYFEGYRILKDVMPKVSIIENVKNLTSKRFSNEFNSILKDLSDLGYNNYWQVLNSKDYGIPQNRERVFIVSIRKDVDKGTFKFPEKEKLRLRLKDMIEDKVNAESLEAKTICLNSKGGRNGIEGLQPSLKDRIYDIRGISACIATSNFFMPKYLVKGKTRSLSAKECWRLMGFDDEDFEKAKATGNSDSQLYKQAGNSIVVSVLEKIFKELFKEVEK